VHSKYKIIVAYDGTGYVGWVASIRGLMNNKIYKAIIIVLSMCSITIRAMESESSASSNIIPIHISMPRNAGVRQSFVEDFDVTQDDPILLDSFENLIQGKKKKNDEYILARAITQTDDGAVVNYFDAHELNRALFGAYPFKNLEALEKYKNPASNLPMQWLEYYECAPDTRVFTFMCTYAALRGSDQNKKDFWHCRFYANQDDNLRLTAAAKNNLGLMYVHGEGMPVDYTKAMRLFEEVAQQEDDLGVAAIAKNNLEVMKASGCIDTK